jgi:hypothetical protein
MSGANPNKICLIKGSAELTSGQHYAKFDGQTTWKWQGWNHPLIAPIKDYNVQVHHFKWDSSCGERIREVANTNKDYAYSEEYRRMYRSLAKCRFKIDITNWNMEYCPTPNYENYKNWNRLLNKIISL